MRSTILATAVWAGFGLVAFPALAQPAETAPPPPAAAPPHLAAGSPVDIEITDAISTKVIKRGDKFAIRLAYPLALDGKVVVSAGVTGVGEVIDAAPAGALGRPAKLLLAVRYLDFNGGQLRLKGFQMGASGTDNTNLIMAASTVPIAGMFAGFIRGGEIEIPAGARGKAKLAADLFPTDAAPAAPAVPALQPTQ